jgi:hypothetical protein
MMHETMPRSDYTHTYHVPSTALGTTPVTAAGSPPPAPALSRSSYRPRSVEGSIRSVNISSPCPPLPCLGGRCAIRKVDINEASKSPSSCMPWSTLLRRIYPTTLACPERGAVTRTSSIATRCGARITSASHASDTPLVRYITRLLLDITTPHIQYVRRGDPTFSFTPTPRCVPRVSVIYPPGDSRNRGSGDNYPKPAFTAVGISQTRKPS